MNWLNANLLDFEKNATGVPVPVVCNTAQVRAFDPPRLSECCYGRLRSSRLSSDSHDQAWTCRPPESTVERWHNQGHGHWWHGPRPGQNNWVRPEFTALPVHLQAYADGPTRELEFKYGNGCFKTKQFDLPTQIFTMKA